jgi:pimeloyl-ACP methyl ester carboxylesterase
MFGTCRKSLTEPPSGAEKKSASKRSVTLVTIRLNCRSLRAATAGGVHFEGYGGRPGGLGERRFVEDAKQTVRRAHEAFDGPLFLVGESLGCGVAAAVAADPAIPAEGLVMITPWDSLPAVAQALYWHLPIQRLVRDKYDNVRNLRAYEKPVAVLLAECDEIIPRKNSMRLYESLAVAKRLWVFAGAGHNSWPIGPNEQWWREVMDFVSARQEKRSRR